MSVVDLIEDVEWMLQGGESLTGAAVRLGGYNPLALERLLLRKHRVDLVRRLRSNEPIKMHGSRAA